MEQFPTLIGLAMESKMTPNFNNHITPTAGGFEVRTNLRSAPLWDFEISFEFLQNRRNGSLDLETIQAFFLNRKGSFEAFLFDQGETPYEDGILLGVGNGVTTDFLLLRSIGTYLEIAGGVLSKTDIILYRDGVLVDYADFSLIDNRTISFSVAPTAGVEITADYKPLFRVRFAEDMMELSAFMSRLWELNELQLKGVFL